MRASRLVFGFLFVCAFAPVAVAENPPAMQPTSEHESLAAHLGSWSGKAEVKAGAFGPGGTMTWSEECSWFGGSEFHVICNSEGNTPTGPEKSLGVLGYNPEKKVYTSFTVEDTGWSGYAEGTKTGDAWTLWGEETTGGKTYRTRYRMTQVTPERWEFDWAMSENGTDWLVVMEGASVKK
ncbi:MAG: hypothetical protein C3F15_02660 [Holophagae bacterium]|nr:MAG: hypothetical protein C3F15_02660 [Holophagae bacterium]